MQIAPYSGSSFYGAANANPYTHAAPQTTSSAAGGQDSDSATILTLSDAALATLAAPKEADFSEVVLQARELLNGLLDDAGRRSPLEGGKLALDMSRLEQRELHAIAVTDDGLFTGDERKAASLELDRRFALALSGPAAVSAVTGDYGAVYKAAAEYLDAQSAEQKAEPAWRDARDAVSKALEILAGDPKSPPQGVADDPVARYLASVKQGDGAEADAGSLAHNMRAALDKLYSEAQARGLNPTFNKSARSGHYIDLSEFASHAVSAMALNRDSLFSADEVRAAAAEMKSRSNAALVAAYEHAGQSGDPTAFSLNIISVYSSMSADERQAADWSDALLNAAMSSYETNAKLIGMLSGSNSTDGMMSWFSR